MRTFKHVLVLLLTVIMATNQHIYALEEGAQQKVESLESTHIAAVTTLPWGIAAGEFDARSWLNPYNGVYFSRDLGENWSVLGLNGRGVTDLTYCDNRLYATTYYHVNNENGLFISKDGGNTFTSAGLHFSASKVICRNNLVLLGGYSHGLWLSKDYGVTWEQKIGNGSGWAGPQITNLMQTASMIIAITPTQTYVSFDDGESWDSAILDQGIRPTGIHHLDDISFLANSVAPGIYTSKDLGRTWSPLGSWDKGSINKLYGIGTSLFVQQDTSNDIYKSADFGKTWELYSDNSVGEIIDVSLLFSYPAYFFEAIQDRGLYREAVIPLAERTEPFLDTPWNTVHGNLTDNITSYFDHELPLLSYPYHKEPIHLSSDSLNFFGLKEHSPSLFGSGHNGTDFALPYGTEIIAPASGMASYYYCSDCGHSIKVDHLNGYQSTYMHLQKDDLVAGDYTDSVWVNRGDRLGRIGMTGRTTGPHLHFSVMMDKDDNGLFDDYPDGLIDPFGWKNKYSADPWPLYSWNDILGSHSGAESRYLWDVPLDQLTKYIFEPGMAVLENKFVMFDSAWLNENPYTILLGAFIKPIMPIDQVQLEYIKGTSFTMSFYDNFGTNITDLNQNITLKIDLTGLSLENVVKETLKIYFWDEVIQKWHALDTILNISSNTLSASTNHLSHFAVLGEKEFPHTPQTRLIIQNEEAQNDGWFIEYPVVELATEDLNGTGIDNVFYTTGSNDWRVYTGPSPLAIDGIVNFSYRAIDNAGNLEPVKSILLKVNTKNNPTDRVTVYRTEFTIAK